MAEDLMPATEAEAVAAEQNDELQNYELAFHILPTVAEEEVANVQSALRDTITKAGGAINTEEAAARFELAYDIDKEVDGKRRAFDTAYFGWIRFTSEAAALEEIKEHVDAHAEVLRSMIVKLTKEEVANPFMVHELKVKMPEMGDDEDAGSIESKTENEEDAEVKEEELDDSLDKITQ